MEPVCPADPPEDVSLLGRPPLYPTRKPMELQESPKRTLLRTNMGIFTWRKILLLFILTAFTIMLLIIGNKEDVAIERSIEGGEIERVRHVGLKPVPEDDVDIVVEKSDNKVAAVDEVDVSDKSGDASTESKANQSEKSEMKAGSQETVAKEPKTEQPAESSTKDKDSSSTVNSRGLLGFHNPSPQNFITSAIYFKPKGVGYPLRPTGGLHPIYAVDLPSASEINTTITNMPNLDAQILGDYSTNSPYADPRLKMTDEERANEQKEYLEKLASIREEWGVWNFVDEKPDRPVMDWSNVKKKDGYDFRSGEIESDEFDEGVWQGDDVYIKNFLAEAKALVSRVREAIYAEYGVATSTLTPEQKSQRDIQLGVHIVKESDPPTKSIDASKGIAWMHEPSFHALVKKLLNAMMTNDHFFVTLGGHSAAAGHGNNFHQSYMMQFQEVMEPVFDRLGMVLVSANRAQGGMGTIQTALAGETIYGEKDVMLWDSSMTEKGGGNQEFFHRQMLLTGHRVPILLDLGGGKSTMDAVHKESGAHVGGVTLGTPDLLATTKSVEQAETLPFALRHLFCEKGVTTCTDGKYKYTAACWTDRVDVEPAKEQNKGYGSQVSWHPGNRSHQWVARKLSLLFLHALEEAINVWEGASSDGNPLPGKYWHLSDEEHAIREKLLSVDVASTECGKFLTKLPRLCSTPMRGATEWLPRAYPDQSSIRSLLKPAPNGYVPVLLDLKPEQYGGREAHMPVQQIPQGEVDVAAIARSIPELENKRLLLGYSSQNISLKQQQGKNLLRKQQSRRLAKIVPGEGWAIDNYAAGFCDGTTNQVCRRDPSSDCLMSGHSDSRGEMVGDALSGWLTFQLKGVSHGIFAGRIQYWHAHSSNKQTEGWNSVNNGREDKRRDLKAPPPPLPDDFRFEIAVDGALRNSYTGDEFKALCEPHIAYNVPFCVLLDDDEIAKKNEKKDMEISIRIMGGGRDSVLGITHIYYA